MDDKKACENILTFLVVAVILIQFFQLLADLPESFPSLIRFIIAVTGLYALSNACGCIAGILADHSDAEENKRALLTIGKWTLLGVFLIAISKV